MKNKIIILTISLVLITGCLEKKGEEEKIPSSFKTLPFKIGDKITYNLWGKMLVEGENGIFIYRSEGEATIEIKKANIEDGFGNKFETVEFYMEIEETPYNITPEGDIADLSIKLEKHIYRLYNDGLVGGIIKSIDIHHAINRDIEIEINTLPINDFLDYFLQREFMDETNGTLSYEGMQFKWHAEYDKDKKALKIIIEGNPSLEIWLKNEYPLPYQIVFKQESQTRKNQYTFELKSFKRGKGDELKLGDVEYYSNRTANFSEWKGIGVPNQGENSQMKMQLKEAMAIALKYESLKNFLKENPESYMIYAEYWESNEKAGWYLHFGNKNLKKDFVLNITEGAIPIQSEEISPYFPYKEVPKDMDEISNKLLDIDEAEKLFKEFIDYNFRNFSFRVSFIEIYYPDTLFDIWEGNSKEKEISLFSEAKGACYIDGFYKMVKDWAFGYRLVGAYIVPFISFDGKINAENGMITYIYKEY